MNEELINKISEWMGDRQVLVFELKAFLRELGFENDSDMDYIIGELVKNGFTRIINPLGDFIYNHIGKVEKLPKDKNPRR